MRGARLIASGFGCGFLPLAPGSWGSLAALPFAWAIAATGGSLALLAAALAVFAVGWRAAEIAAPDGQARDPGWIVIDEIAGQWLTLLAAPLSLPSYAAGFLLFRAFDILKPWPVRWSERRFSGGFGIMIDDVLAAIYAAVVLAIGRTALAR